MLKFIRGKGSHISAERVKVQKELFSFRKTITHGFPSKPTSLAYSPQLGLVAVATKSGAIVVVGRPGVEFVGQHPQQEESAVTKILFVPKKARVITLCDDNSLHLWKFANSSLELVKSYSLEGKLKKISHVAVQENNKNAYVGTEGGNVYTLDIDKFEIGDKDKIIYLDVVLQNGPENYKVNPGAVETILEVPNEMKLLIGYERGLIVLWDIVGQKNIKNFVSTQQLEDLTWLEEYSDEAEEDKERLFASAHNDGSYIIWNLENNEKPYKDISTPYGPFPCKRIGKLRFWKDDNGELIVAFSGGMPRATYGDHFTVTIKSEAASEGEEPHVAFDLTSKVIDFAVIWKTEEPDSNSNGSGTTTPSALVILAEEEMVTVDLTSDNWPIFFPQPYLNSIHPSAVTCFHHVADVADEVYNALVKIGLSGEFSKNAWPVTGGKMNTPLTTQSSKKGKNGNLKSLLITGHEDGSVRFWDSTTSCLSIVTKFSSSVLFSMGEEAEFANESSNNREDDEEEWPPFRKVGTFDPYSDDPRLAVKKVGFCKTSGVLTIGGTAGQIIVVNSVKKLVLQEEATKLEVTTCNMVADKDGFVWKGHDALDYKPKNNPNIGSTAGEDSFNITALLQIQPPAAVTALAIEAPSGVVAVGTAHGVLLFDFFRKKVVMIKSTLNPNDIMAAGDTPISRRKSIKKSLRESFRRLRKGRSQRAGSSSPIKSPSLATMQSPESSIPTKPMERAIEARGSDDAMSSMVRSVTFAKTYIVSMQTTTPTLWAGTNSGTVYVFTVNVPGGERRSKEDVSCQIAKEIQLKHRAPVLSVIILDCGASPVEGFSPKHDHLGPHKVLICSEEQIKIFTLPTLRPFGKLKLTAQEGSRIRKIGVQSFVSSADDCYSEKCASCLTNQGDLYIITVPELRKQIMFPQCLKREDITGISSFTFNEVGEAFYQISSSELQRLSTSARVATRPLCSVVGVVDGKEIASNHVEENHIVEISSPSVSNSIHSGIIDDLTSELGDITIDSVRDHTTSNAATTINTTVVEERLIDGGTLISPVPGVTNQIKSVTTVTTTTVVNSVQTSTANQECGSSTNGEAANTTSSTSTSTTVIRAPLADNDEEIESRTSSEI